MTEYKEKEFLDRLSACIDGGDLDDKAAAYKNAGRASHELKDFEKAEELYKKATAFDKNFAPAYFYLGNLINELGRKTEAEEQYRLAIKADPSHAFLSSYTGA